MQALVLAEAGPERSCWAWFGPARTARLSHKARHNTWGSHVRGSVLGFTLSIINPLAPADFKRLKFGFNCFLFTPAISGTMRNFSDYPTNQELPGPERIGPC
jgi:hypothetical protein